MRIIALGITIFLISFVTLAADAPYCSTEWVEQADADCGGGGTGDTTRCLDDKVSNVDKVLNDSYRMLKKELVAPKDLVKAERKWLAFRKTECDRQYSEQGCDTQPGSICGLTYTLCYLRLTCARVVELKNQIKQR